MEQNNLDNMPDLVIEKILKECNYQDIQSLRKSNVYLRDIVARTNPDPKVKNIYCTLSEEKIVMILDFFVGESLYTFYENGNDGCAVVKNDENEIVKSRQFFENTTAVDLFGRDFQILKDALNHQELPLREFTVRMDGDDPTVFHDTIGMALTALSPLRVRWLIMAFNDPRLFLWLLTTVSPEILRHLEMVAEDDTNAVLNLDEIVQLPHWRSVESVAISEYRIDDLITVINKPRSIIPLAITPERAIQLKETFQNSQTFESCSIDLENREDLVPALQAIIPDVADNIGVGLWHFRTARPGMFLWIRIVANDYLLFQSMDAVHVHEGAVILD